MHIEDLSTLRLADRARDRKDWVAASSLYQDVLSLSPQDAAIWVQYGHASKESGMASRAEAAYRQATFFAPGDSDIRLQLGHLLKVCGDTTGAIKAYREAFALAEGALVAEGKSDAGTELASLNASVPRSTDIRFNDSPLLIDVGDVVRYARRFDRPTGIQRVQIAVIDSLMAEMDVGRALSFIMREPAGHWVHVSSLILKQISARLSGATTDKQDQVPVLSPVSWPKGATYLMLGTSWDDRSHSKALAALKRDEDLRVAAFIHDLVPVNRPDLCVPGLQHRFDAWLAEALPVTDRWISNSEFTAGQLMAFAKKRGAPPPHVRAVPLNARLPAVPNAVSTRQGHEEIVKQLALDVSRTPFVLAVGTLEPRKNYTKLVAAWRQVCATRPSSPVLILVGKIGWSSSNMINAVERAKADGIDIRHVSGLSDHALNTLYSYCDFTIYPSLMEGWGLPITEALAHGKIPVVGRHSGISEAAGMFGYYVDVESVELMAHAISQLISDGKTRAMLEAQIKTSYRGKTWMELTHSILDAALEPESV
jgi:glycosyltransferase involved in cell wall biosynthesis